MINTNPDTMTVKKVPVTPDLFGVYECDNCQVQLSFARKHNLNVIVRTGDDMNCLGELHIVGVEINTEYRCSFCKQPVIRLRKPASCVFCRTKNTMIKEADMRK
jgi:DNA-directed RNA polymerase subunit RPC12/RpoP